MANSKTSSIALTEDPFFSPSSSIAALIISPHLAALFLMSFPFSPSITILTTLSTFPASTLPIAPLAISIPTPISATIIIEL
ncbi:hypothetical protein IEQ34_007990 [Dendrobium chrysotoxum]|uniref:Uncharacterized protein n=1 Tax=Dendrobium chrysotoxum TaxID=161865 RepID=A0AAV7H5Z6_DENCH|nr:hypothetical protein IEQ34_007990 [Dendrobium chrysotoxum]